MASSRPYRVTIRESVREVQVAEDHIETRIETPPVCSPEQARPIMERILREHGFEDDGAGGMSRTRKGVKVDVDPASGHVRAGVSATKDLDISAEKDGPDGCNPCAERARDRIREGLRSSLRDQADESKADLQRKTSAGLEDYLSELGCEMETISNQATSSAIKKKAQELGEIKSISQDDKGNMTIVVEVPM